PRPSGLPALLPHETQPAAPVGLRHTGCEILDHARIHPNRVLLASGIPELVHGRWRLSLARDPLVDDLRQPGVAADHDEDGRHGRLLAFGSVAGPPLEVIAPESGELRDRLLGPAQHGLGLYLTTAPPPLSGR